MYKRWFLIFCLLNSFAFAQAFGEFKTLVLRGKEIEPYVNDITDLILTVFREYPYLYEGTHAEYAPFIQNYAQEGLGGGLACLLLDDQKPIGVAIGISLSKMRERYLHAFLKFLPEEKLPSYFYLGELVLLPEYRGKGLGKKLYLSFEEEVTQDSTYQTLCFCKIMEKDPPANYQTLYPFWLALGYVEHPNYTFTSSWKEVGQLEQVPHEMIGWTKDLR